MIVFWKLISSRRSVIGEIYRHIVLPAPRTAAEKPQRINAAIPRIDLGGEGDMNSTP